MKSHSFKWVLPLSIFSILFSAVDGQTVSAGKLDSLSGNFIKTIRRNSHEKILLQTDKSFYLSGETVWFRAFCLNALTGQISTQSKILFLDLVDEKDQVVRQVLLNIPRQRLEGDFAIPADAQEGYYWIRAYTKKILKEDSTNICVLPIYVLNPRKPDTSTLAKRSKRIKAAPVSGEPIIAFYPEGGSLISATNSIVAVSAKDRNGQPLELSGYVKDSWDTVVATFKTNASGLGKFGLDIWKARKYTAHVTGPGNVDYAYPLPQINQYATQVSMVTQNDNSFQIRVSLGDSLYHRNKIHTVLGISHGNLCFAGSGTDMFEAWIPKQNFPKGIATLLVFNDQEQVVSERNIYIDRSNEMIQIKADKTSYNAREKAKLDISITDSLNKPIRAYFTVAVTDDNMDKQTGLDDRSEDPNLDKLDLPANTAKFSRDDWDLAMLTQPLRYIGWRPSPDFDEPVQTNYLSDHSLQSIHGIVADEKNRPVANQVVTLFSTQKNLVFIADTTDNMGRFNFELPQEYTDSTQFTVQVANLNGTKQDKKIQIDHFPFPQPVTPAALKTRFDSSQMVVIHDYKTLQLDTLKFGKGKEWLKEVTVKANRKKPVTYDEKKRLSYFSKIITNDDLVKGGVNSLGNALLMAPGIQLRNGYISIRGGSGYGNGPTTEPLLVVDGVPLSAPSSDTGLFGYPGSASFILQYLSQISPNEVDFIEVLAGPEAAIYGARAAHGVISVNTSPGIRHDDAYALRGMQKYFTRGYLVPQQFTFPDYDIKEIKKSSYPDLRSTIYWNGNINTDENGKASEYFFTADPPTTYTVSLMGVTEQGSILYKKVKIARK